MFKLVYNGETIGQVAAAKIDKGHAHLLVRVLNVATGNMENFESTRVHTIIFDLNRVCVYTRSGSSYEFIRMCETHGKTEWATAKAEAEQLCDKLSKQMPWWAVA